MPEFIVERDAGVIDCVVVGEGEETMLELVNAYERGASIDGIRGIAFAADGKTVRTAPRPLLEALDTLPRPARDLIPQDLFAPNMHNARHRNCLSILTSRGCPFNCSFCASRIVSGKRYRTHSAEYVLEEMKRLKKDHGARQLLITDDTFTIDRERLERICRGMIDAKLGLSWFCFSQVTTVDPDALKLMKKAGCYSIGFGIESADERTLKAMGKPISPGRAKEAVRAANAAGLKTQAFYIVGFPGETREQMEKTIAFSRVVDATLTFYNMLVPYPGTKEFQHYFGATPLDEIDWQDFVAVGERCVLRDCVVPVGEIQKLIARANTRYYSHPARLLKLVRHIRTFHELANYARGGVSLAKQIAGWSGRRGRHARPGDGAGASVAS